MDSLASGSPGVADVVVVDDPDGVPLTAFAVSGFAMELMKSPG